jgi:hypothetical protein
MLAWGFHPGWFSPVSSECRSLGLFRIDINDEPSHGVQGVADLSRMRQYRMRE